MKLILQSRIHNQVNSDKTMEITFPAEGNKCIMEKAIGSRIPSKDHKIDIMYGILPES